MVIRTERIDDQRLVIRVSGEIDVYNAPTLGETVKAHTGSYRVIVVDLSEVGYIDSAGIGMLSGCQGHVEELGGQLRIVTTNERVLRAIRIAGVPDLRIISPSVEAALDAAEAVWAKAEGVRTPLRGDLQLTLLRKPEFVSTARLVVGSVGARLNLSYEELEDVKLAVSEACTNAIMHGSGQAEDHIHLQVRFDEKALEVEVRDPSTHVDWGEIQARGEAGGRQGPGGMGLLLMKHLVDDVQFESSPRTGNCVRLTKRLSP